MTDPIKLLCPDERLSELMRAIEQETDQGEHAVADLLRQFPADPRLHFLLGSLAAGHGNLAGAHAAMAEAVAIAPDYAIARFQYGLLLLTSDDAQHAAEILSPLRSLPDSEALRHFAEALLHLIDDRFEDAKLELEQGIAANHDNGPLNRDMRLLLETIATRAHDPVSPLDEPFSATHMLLQQSALKSTKH